MKMWLEEIGTAVLLFGLMYLVAVIMFSLYYRRFVMSMYANKDKYESGDVARIIWEQLGGNKFRMMTGAKNLLNLGDGLAMKLGRNSSNSNYLKITLNSMDTYDMMFAKLTKKGELKSVSEYKNVYNDLMRGTFTAHTGMYTSLF